MEKKHNIILSVLVLVSIGVLVRYSQYEIWAIFQFTGSLFIKPEISDGIAFNLSIGIVVSAIFYLILVYFPEKKRNKFARDCVSARLNTIIYCINNPISTLGNKYNSKHHGENFTDDELAEIMKLKFNDTVEVIDVKTMKKISVRVFISKCLYKTEFEIDKLYTYYPSYISAELMDVLERLLKCQFHNSMADILKLPKDVDLSGIEDIYFSSYYKLMNELKEVQKKQYPKH